MFRNQLSQAFKKHLSRRLTTKAVQRFESLAEAETSIEEHGYAVMSGRTHAEMAGLARKLLALEETELVEYKSKTGIVRGQYIDNSVWTNVAAGTYPYLPVGLHQEMAYACEFPKRIAFGMIKQARTGGNTVLADAVKMTEELPQAMLDKFEKFGVKYIRNLNDKSEKGQAHYYNSWQDTFDTESKEEALASGTETAQVCELPDGRLRQTSSAPVHHTDPKYGKVVVSTILSRHGSSFDGHSAYDHMPWIERPLHCVWGDDSEFSLEELTIFRTAVHNNSVALALQEGDVVIVDNVRIMHGRQPFEGERKIGIVLSHKIPRVW